jgi:hypothetical protein
VFRKVLWFVAGSVALFPTLARAQGTLRIRVLGYSVVSQQSGNSNCNFWTSQYGFTYGSCHALSRNWVLNAVESDSTRYLLACRAALFGKCARLTDVGGTYDAESCGDGMCVHVLYGKHRKLVTVKYRIVEAVVRR